jgi:hypothetical protein
VFPSDLPGVNPATLNGMLLYYRLMSKWSGLGDSTELSRVGLSQTPFDTPMSPGTFVAFSKFHLNTSNSPNVKVVYFVEECNMSGI